MMGRGPLRIDGITLRKLLPLWMRSIGFVLDGSKAISKGFLIIDGSVEGHGAEEVAGYLSSMLKGLMIVDGSLWYQIDEKRKIVYVKVDLDEDLLKHKTK